MNSTAITLTDPEIKLRKMWVRWAVVNFFLLPLVPLIFYVFIPNSTQEDRRLLLLIIDFLFSSVFSFALYYYFSYKKYGTFLLTLTLIFMPIALIIAMIIPVKISWSVPDIVSSFLHVSVSAVWYVVCWKLRQLNLAIKDQALPSNHPLLIRMEEALDLDDLDAKFSAAIKEVPQFKRRLSKFYKERKRVLQPKSKK